MVSIYFSSQLLLFRNCVRRKCKPNSNLLPILGVRIRRWASTRGGVFVERSLANRPLRVSACGRVGQEDVGLRRPVCVRYILSVSLRRKNNCFGLVDVIWTSYGVPGARRLVDCEQIPMFVTSFCHPRLIGQGEIGTWCSSFMKY